MPLSNRRGTDQIPSDYRRPRGYNAVMRITGGTMGGRKLRVPMVASFRPTQDMVREALGSMLVTEIPGSRFLDLYAGSGAVGLEALSRGAASVTWVEADRRNWKLLRENAESLGVDAAQSYCADALKWVSSFGKGHIYDIIFADPPYADTRENGIQRLMELCAKQGMVPDGGIFVSEQASDTHAVPTEGWEILRDREYGKTRLVIWRKLPAEGAEETAKKDEANNG